jgi:hypothetical protein
MYEHGISKIGNQNYHITTLTTTAVATTVPPPTTTVPAKSAMVRSWNGVMV